MPIRVDGTVITDRELHGELQRLQQRQQQIQQHRQQQGLPPPTGLAAELEQQRLHREAEDIAVNRYLLQQEAKRRYPKVDSADVDDLYAQVYGKDQPKEAGEYDQRRVRLKNHVRLRRLLDEIAGDLPEPTEQEIFDTYMRQRDRFTRPATVHAAHLVKHLKEGVDREAAMTILQQAQAELAAGADFAEVASRHSDCPERGGDLGRFPKGQMVEAFEQVVFALQPGENSAIFETEFGLHIARVHDRQEATAAPLDEVRDHLRDELIAGQRDERLDAFIGELRAKATIERD